MVSLMTPKAEQTINRLQDALKHNRGVVGSEVIQLIHSLSGRAFSISLSEIGDFIRSDVTLTAKVISAANTMEFNYTASPVSTVTQAINLIGFNRIRSLTMSLLLIENAASAKDPEEQREVVAVALASGLFAQRLMAKLGSSDPEQAFVCSSLRNYGRVLLTAFMRKEYLEALALSRTMGMDDAFIEVFGLTPIMISHHVLMESKMPKSILNTLRKSSLLLMEQTQFSTAEELVLVSEFSEKLTELALVSDYSASQFKEATTALCEKYMKNLSLKPEEIPLLFGGVERELRIFNNSYGFKTFLNPFLEVIKDRAKGESPPTRGGILSQVYRPQGETRPPFAVPVRKDELDVAMEGEESVLLPHSETPKSHLSEKEETARLQIIQNANRQLTEKLTELPVPLRSVFQLAVESIHKSFHVDDSILFVQDVGRVRYTASYGMGPLYNRVREQPLIDTIGRDIFALSLRKRDDIFIKDARTKRLQPILPQWLINYRRACSFALFPLLDQQTAFGLWFIACNESGALMISKSLHQEFQAMRIHLMTAHRMATQM
jgi:HD-like signal output (HDOD) protein